MGTAACGSSATIRSSSHHNVPTCRCRCSHFHEAFTTHRANKRGSSTSNNPHHDDAKKNRGTVLSSFLVGGGRLGVAEIGFKIFKKLVILLQALASSYVLVAMCC